jgi:hypothetical protein
MGKNWFTLSSCMYFMVIGRESNFYSFFLLSTFFAPKLELSLQYDSESLLSSTAWFERFSGLFLVNLSLVVYPVEKLRLCVNRR